MPNPPPTAQEAPWPRPAYAWYVLGVISLAYTFSIIDRIIFALLIEPIRLDLEISDTQVGILGGFAFALFYTIMALPLGRMADRFDRRLIISCGIFTWSLMTAACGLAQNFWQLFFARMGVGVGEATISPAGHSMLSDYFPPDKLSRALSIYMLGAHLGGGLAFVVGGMVIALVMVTPGVSLHLVGELRSWQLAFIAVGLPGIPLAVLMMTLREPARRGTVVATGKDKSEMVITQTQGLPLRQVAGFMASGRRTYALHFMAFGLFGLCLNAVVIWLPTTFIRTYGWTPGEIGPAMGTIMMVCGVPGTLLGGWLSDRLRRRGIADAPIRIALFSLLAIAPTAALMPLMPTAPGCLAMLGLVMFLMGLPMAPSAAAMMLITPNQMRAQVSAVFLFVANIIGTGMGPLAVGLVTDYVFGDEMAVGTSLAIVVGVAAPISALLLFLELAPFRASVEKAKAWSGRQTPVPVPAL